MTRLRQDACGGQYEMLDGGQIRLLFISFLPYTTIALYDAWLHERARQVPLSEQALHAAAFVTILLLLSGLLFGQRPLVFVGVSAFAALSAVDEVGFHRGLARRERLMHFLAYACFAGFAIVATRIGALL